MRPIKHLIQLDEALSLALDRTIPIDRVEEVSLEEASFRVSAEDIVSRIYVPPFTRSAMDGYAVRAKDTYGAGRLRPLTLKRLEAVYAGAEPKEIVGKGECSEIATGAMLPKGSDAVIMVEDTEIEDDSVLIYASVHPGQNTSKKGEDISPGAKIISRDEVLNPGKIGAIAALGKSRVKVYQKPLVAVVPTGNEIAPLEAKLRPGQVYNINSYTLSSAVRANGCQSRMLPIVGDTLSDLEKVLAENADCDVIVFSGGSSVGERDIMLDVLERNGEVVFHGIAVKPGKPTLFGTVNGKLVFGMPGYPTACLSNAYIMLAPVLRRLSRLPPKITETVKAKMDCVAGLAVSEVV